MDRFENGRGTSDPAIGSGFKVQGEDALRSDTLLAELILNKL